MRRPTPLIFLLLTLISLSAAIFLYTRFPKPVREASLPSPLPLVTTTPPPASPSPSPSPSPTPTLTPAEREAKYGPCVYLPVLMFHHLAPEDLAKAGGFASLNVTPTFFENDLKYLKTKNYTTISPTDLAAFFDSGTPLPSHPLLLTFDDGYADFYTYALPLLKQYSAKATLFVPTGLMDNPNYLTWGELGELNGSGLVYLANHTWSHHSAFGDLATETREISTADEQLGSRGYNSAKVFAYPYGSPSQIDKEVLQSLGYSLAFTTTHGSWQCKGQKYTLPRIRIGNTSLSAYGL